MLYSDYSHSLLDVFADFPVLFRTLWCCPLQNALTKARLDGRSCTACDCLVATVPVPPAAPYPVCMPYHNRQQLRSKYGMQLAPCHDALTILFCYPCSIMQDAREAATREERAVRGRRPTTRSDSGFAIHVMSGS